MTTIEPTVTPIRAPGGEYEVDEAQLAAVSFLARYNGRTLEAYRHDLRGFFQWATDHGIAVASAGVHFVDLEDAYAGHEVCGSAGEFINGPTLSWRLWERPWLGSFHPKPDGHYAAASAINALVRDWIRDGKPLTSASLPANPTPQGGGAAPLGPASEADSSAAVVDLDSPRPTLNVSRTPGACASASDTLAAGETVTARGTSWAPSTTVILGFRSPDTGEIIGVNATTDSTGGFEATITMPAVATPIAGGFEAYGLAGSGTTARVGLLAQLTPLPGPCANDDSLTTTVGRAVAGPVLANDTGAPEVSSLEIIDSPVGIATIQPSTGVITYTPHGDFTGIDAFTYRVCDTGGICDTAVVTIDVQPSCTISGTSGDDTLTGTSGDDVLCGLGGNDTIEGLDGNDLLLGGPGIDRLFGGPGDDVVYGGSGDDALNGGPGADLLDGGSGTNQMLETADEQAPTITATVPAPGAQYSVGSSVIADYACNDGSGGVGVARCEGPVPDGQPLDTTTPGTFSFEIEAVDWAGNTSTHSASYQVVPP